jgi:hypothetical protein
MCAGEAKHLHALRGESKAGAVHKQACLGARQGREKLFAAANNLFLTDSPFVYPRADFCDDKNLTCGHIIKTSF